jgi:hypothetical protein
VSKSPTPELSVAGEPAQPGDVGYALGIANGSYSWYKVAAIRSRRAYRLSEALFLVVSASIPVSAVIRPNSGLIPAVLGGISVIIAGLRAIFHWQDNYLRFTRAREAVEAERRLYHTGASPYDTPGTRDQLLAQAVSRIEQAEMSGWLKLAVERPHEPESAHGSG